MKVTFEMTKSEIETMLEEEGFEDKEELKELFEDEMEYIFEHYNFDIEVDIKEK